MDKRIKPIFQKKSQNAGTIGKYANLDEALKAKADEARAILKHIKLP